MSAFIGKFKEISSSNLVALCKEQVQGHNVILNQFQVGKEFDSNHHDGTTTKALMVLDDNKLVMTMGDKKGTRIVFEIVGNELRTTLTAGPVVGVITYARQ
ncbi:unnamed protein product [Oppiella nova]|uniref:Uncharacterized protein n=1 Tax=Oppiella nova TaxID=334625 RepID=A0A7R9QSM5_9ACAR|nr:unnamed protein product [Oppiella nova]CAG2173485.1 unnamed protein product [Oppiella nova]